MEAAASKLFELLALVGIGILLTLGAGFWLFHTVKKAGEERDSQAARPPTKH